MGLGSLGLLAIITLILFRDAQAQTNAPAPAPAGELLYGPEITQGKELTVCAADGPPNVICNPQNATTSYSGFDIEVFRKIAQELDLMEGRDYNFKCLPFTEIMTQLTLPNGTCDIGVSAITITTSRSEQGIQFSYPYYNTGLGILVRTTPQSPSGWDWITPFSVWLWVAVILTMVIFPLCIFLIEFGSIKKRIYKSDVVPGVTEATFRSLWTLMGMETLQVSSFGAKFASITFAFMALILINTYTANLAAVLTVNQINSQIRSVNDLRGKAVTSNAVYQSRLRTRYGILATDLDYNSINDLYDASQEVADGTLAALITDEPLLKYMLSTQTTCTTNLLSGQIEPFSYGIAFKVGTNPAVVASFSDLVLSMQEDGTIPDLEQSFFEGHWDHCGDVNSSSNRVSFTTLYGLWVIAAAGIAVGFISMFVTRRRTVVKRRKTKRQREKGGAMPPQAAQFSNMTSVVNGGMAEESRLGAVEEGQGEPSEEVVAKWQTAVTMSQLQVRESLVGEQTWDCGGVKKLKSGRI